jgi:hypothetical protein
MIDWNEEARALQAKQQAKQKNDFDRQQREVRRKEESERIAEEIAKEIIGTLSKVEAIQPVELSYKGPQRAAFGYVLLRARNAKSVVGILINDNGFSKIVSAPVVESGGGWQSLKWEHFAKDRDSAIRYLLNELIDGGGFIDPYDFDFHRK